MVFVCSIEVLSMLSTDMRALAVLVRFACDFVKVFLRNESAGGISRSRVLSTLFEDMRALGVLGW